MYLIVPDSMIVLSCIDFTTTASIARTANTSPSTSHLIDTYHRFSFFGLDKREKMVMAVGSRKQLLQAARHHRRCSRRRSRCAAAGTGFGKSKDKGGSESRKPLVREALQLAVKGDVDGLREFALNNMKRFDQDFWIAIAEEVDNTESEEGKERLRQLANSVRHVCAQALSFSLSFSLSLSLSFQLLNVYTDVLHRITTTMGLRV